MRWGDEEYRVANFHAETTVDTFISTVGPVSSRKLANLALVTLATHTDQWKDFGFLDLLNKLTRVANVLQVWTREN